MSDPRRLLIGGGLLLSLLGLFSGLLVGAMAAPRVGLAAHLAAVTNGVLLIAIGAIWDRIDLSDRLLQMAAALLLYGTFANWGSVQLAAFWGAGGLLPIANPAPVASAWQEAVVSAGLLSLSLAMIAGLSLILWGFLRGSGAKN